MNKILNIDLATDLIDLPGGDKIVLIDRLGKGDQYSAQERARNVYRVDVHGRVKWEIHSDFDADGDPFTKLRFENGLTAYRWDGATYVVDLENGAAVPLLLER